MKKNPFVQGAMIATLGIIISKILGVIYVIPFYSIIGSKGGALYGYAYSIYSIFLNLTSIGIPLAISRLISEYNTLEKYHLKEKTYRVGQGLTLALSIISFIILILFAPTIAHIFIGDIKGGNTIDDVTFVIRIVATAILIVPILSVTKGYMQGHKYITVPTISQVLEQLFRVIIIVIGSYIAIKVLHMPIKAGVGIAVFAATIGGLIAYIYIQYKMHKYKDKLNRVDPNSRETSKISNKDVCFKIIGYATPFVFTSLIGSFYGFSDMAVTVKVMVHNLHYSVSEAETTLGILSTWGSKLNMVISSVATGLVTSLIPNMTASFVKNDLVDVRSKINRSLQMFFCATLPMTLGVCLLSTPIWTIFYGYDVLSSEIFSYYIFTALFASLITTLSITMQFLNEYKKLFMYVASGLVTKIIFNVPLMYSFYRIGLPAGYGVISASILGYTVSSTLILYHLYKKLGVRYEQTVKRLFLIIYACLVMTVVILLLQLIIPINVINRIDAVIVVLFYTFIGLAVYLFITIKQGILVDIFGHSFINKILVKLKLKKLNISE